MKTKQQMLRVVLIAVCAAANPGAQTPAAQSAPQAVVPAAPAALHGATLERKVDELFNAYAAVQGFSGSVLLASQGKPLISKGYGYANVEWQIPNTPQTKFRIASITKQFTSMLVMQLREQGRITLEDSVCVYVEPCPDAWKPVTIHHLLTHTSGIPSYTGLGPWRATMMTPRTVGQVIGSFRDLPLQWNPGERYAYNNSGYFLLGVVIEKVTAKKYEQVLREMILAPLAMNDSGYDWSQTIVPRRASGYRGVGDTFSNAPAIDMQQVWAAGAMYSTVEDLLKWDQALYTEKLLPAAAKTIMWTPFLNNYAYGWSVSAPSPETNGHRRMGHGGGVNGFSANIIRLPDARVTVIVLSNNENGTAGAAARDLLDLYYGQPYTLPLAKAVQPGAAVVDVAVLDAYVGTYELPTGLVITIARQGAILTAEVGPGARPRDLFAESQTAFVIKAVGLSLAFERDASGAVTSIVVRRGGETVRAQRID